MKQSKDETSYPKDRGVALIGSGRVREICGGISEATLYRWLNNANYAYLEFPRPCAIATRNYWSPASIYEFADRQLAKTAKEG